jgi:hypothetical protein
MDSVSDKNENVPESDSQNIALKSNLESFIFNNKDKNVFYLYQKVKKLSAALYLITSLLDENEPLRVAIRSLSTGLLSINAKLYSTPDFKRKEISEKLESIILEAISLLEVGALNGLVSNMNLDVLKREFHEVVVKYHDFEADSETQSVALEPFFLSDENSDHDTDKKGKRSQNSLSENVSYTAPKKNIENTVLYNKTASTKISHEEDLPSEFNEMKSEKLKDFGSVAVKKNRRQSLIVGLLKRKREIMIKDVVGIISDCSEKTIQRELSLLVDSGLLKKEGERRWTRYSLA